MSFLGEEEGEIKEVEQEMQKQERERQRDFEYKAIDSLYVLQ